MIVLLMWIRSDIKALRAEIDKFRSEIVAGFAALRAEIDKFRSEMVAGFAALRAEIDKFRSEMVAGFAAQRSETNRGFERVDGKLDKIVDKLSVRGERIARLEDQAAIPDPGANGTQAE